MARASALVADVAHDARHALRSWRRKPAFASLCILTLAIGIGSVTAVFSVVAAVLVRPLLYAQPDRLVAVWDRHVSDRNLAKIFASYTDSLPCRAPRRPQSDSPPASPPRLRSRACCRACCSGSVPPIRRRLPRSRQCSRSAPPRQCTSPPAARPGSIRWRRLRSE